MTLQRTLARTLAIAALCAWLPGTTALYGEHISHISLGTMETWRIDQPTVTEKTVDYHQIVFQPTDGVIVSSGGCVQTGGSGLTWKRYLNPAGPNSDVLYHGLIQIPGIHSALVRTAGVVATAFTIPGTLNPAQNFLRLGYEDDNYLDNGYSNHDDGTGDQCKGVDPAFVSIDILHNVAPEEWVSVGPDGIPLVNNEVEAGQVNTLAIHPADANTLYIGASEGGVWKTTDGGATWKALTDLQLVRPSTSGLRKGTMSIGSIAIDPNHPETVYVGTGDPDVACCFVGSSLGAFRSADGGNTWAVMGANLTDPKCDNALMSTATVNKLLVYAATPSIVYAATSSGVFNYKDDGGDCWKRMATGMPSGNAIDLAADFNHGALYAALWSQGIYKFDLPSGGPWQKLTGGLPTTGFQRIALAFGGRTASPLPLVYAGFSASGTYRLFKTVNGGALWTELPSPPSDGQLDFNNTLEVGPSDSDEIYIGQVGLWRTTDGGLTGGLNNYAASPPTTTNSWTPLSCCLADSNPFRKGMDVHGDNHLIAFAPEGSFVPDPSQEEVLYVADDGGVAKGTVDSKGVVTWHPMSLGLTIGQCGTIGLYPRNQLQTACGLWHNGNAYTDASLAQTAPVGGGDGFQTTIDAGTPIVYYNCNAGFGGKICRSTVAQYPVLAAGVQDVIWSDNTSSTLWSDPYRPGNLFRLQAGLLFRTKIANTAAPTVLDTPGSWDAVDPFFGKTGKTTTMAFSNPTLATQPIYYLGTDTGQIWRGSPEAGWTKLCECTLPVAAINTYLAGDKIYAVFRGTSGPGRVRMLTHTSSGPWTAQTIDTTFAPDLTVAAVTSIVVDPASSAGTVVYIGTDQGVYRGQLSGSAWSWSRSLGVPNVWVSDLEVNQGNLVTSQVDVVRAGTYGRGIFELKRFTIKDAFLKPAGTANRTPEVPGLNVQAIQVGEDGAPPPVSVRIPVTWPRKSAAQETPFRIAPPPGTEVSLEAPREVVEEGRTLKFMGWAISGDRSEPQPRITLKVEGAMKAVAYYQLSGEPDEREEAETDALRVAVSAAARPECTRGLSHELIVSWEVSKAQQPLSVRSEIIYPDGHLESAELKPLDGSLTFPLLAPKGGKVKIRLIAKDARGSSSAQTIVAVKPCR